MNVIFVGRNKFGDKVTGGQRRFVEAIHCCGLDTNKTLSSFWQVSKNIFKKNVIYVAFDERYLFLCILQLVIGRRVVFFPRGNKVVHFKSSYSRLRLFVYKKIFGWMYARCEFMVFQTKAQMLEFREMYSYAGLVKILPNNINSSWVDVSAIKINAKLISGSLANKSCWQVGFMGGLDKRKGFNVAYDALNDFILDGRVCLHVAGAEAESFKEYNVKAHGYVSGNDLVDFYRACDFIIIPSEYDSFPNVLLEALAYGAIPLISRDRITEEILGVESNLLFVRQGKEIRDTLDLLMSNPELLRRAEDECQALRAKYTFDWCGRVREILELKERVKG